MSEFGERLRQAREAMGWSQGELGEEVGLTQASISQLEKGRRAPTPALVTKLAKALEVERKYFAGDFASEADEGKFERAILMRNLEALSPEQVRKINDIVEEIRKSRQ